MKPTNINTQTTTLLLLSLLLLTVGLPGLYAFKDKTVVSDSVYSELSFTEQIKVCTEGNFNVGFYGGAAFTVVGLSLFFIMFYTWFTREKEMCK